MSYRPLASTFLQPSVSTDSTAVRSEQRPVDGVRTRPFCTCCSASRRRSASCARTRNRLQARDWQQQSALDQGIALEPKFVLAGRSRRAHHHSPLAPCSKERHRCSSNKRFPTLKKKDEAPGADCHHPCAVDADAAPCTRQCIRQTVLLIMPSRHRRDANSMAWRCGLSPLDSASTAACTRPLIDSRAGPGRG